MHLERGSIYLPARFDRRAGIAPPAGTAIDALSIPVETAVLAYQPDPNYYHVLPAISGAWPIPVPTSPSPSISKTA
jgi:hypothetical protein